MDTFSQVHTAIEKSGLPKEVLARLAVAKGSVRQMNVQPQAIQRVAMLGREDGKAHIQLFKNFSDSSRAVQDLLDTYGELILMTSGEAGGEIWQRKLVLADPGVAQKFNEKLKTGNFSSFRSLVESFAGAVERLTALHIANALIYHRISFGDAKNVDVTAWPQTEDLAKGTMPFSLTPLLGAYCDPDVWRNWPVAFRHRVLGTLTCARNDVLTEFKKVIDAVCESSQN